MADRGIYSFKLDAETDARIGADRLRLTQELGLPNELSISQHFRIIVASYLRSPRGMTQQGWAEGYRAGYAAFQEHLSRSIHAYRDKEVGFADAFENALHAMPR